MKAEEVNIKNIRQKIISKNFYHIEGKFYINYFNVFAKNQLVYPLDIYDLVDFTHNDSIIRTVRFYHAFQKGYHLTIIVLDMDTGEMLHRRLRINDDNPRCSWLLIGSNYLTPDHESDDEKVIHDYCNKK